MPDNTGPDYLNNALNSCFDFQPSIPSKEKSEITIQKTYSNVDNILETIAVDEYCSRDVNVQIDYDLQGTFTVETSLNDSISKTISGIDAMAISLKSVDTGSYTVSITGGNKINFLTLLVKCKAKDETEPILTTCWTNAREEGVNVDNSDKLVVYGQAMKGSNPVIGADIKAYLSNDAGNEDELSIKDDGIAPDSIKGDGIYSGYYIPPSATQDGTRYSLICKFEGKNETSVVNTTSPTRSLPSHPGPNTPICCGSEAVKVREQDS